MKALLALLLVAFSAGAALAQTTTPPTYQEVPFFADDVAKGDLPPVAQRLPDNPAVAQFQWPGQVPGKYSKELDMLMSSAKDTRYLVIYGYARLVGYDAHYNLVPDILESFDVQEGRIFTFHLRPGHPRGDLLVHLLGQRHVVGQVKRHDHLRHRGAQHDLDRLRVGPPVELGDVVVGVAGDIDLPGHRHDVERQCQAENRRPGIKAALTGHVRLLFRR